MEYRLALKSSIGKRKRLLLRVMPHQSVGTQTEVLGDACEASLPASSDRRHAPISIRRHTQGPIVNLWLALIVVLGAVIVIVDGFTRPSDSGFGPLLLGPLEYQPYRFAFLLAAVSFPLVIGYSRKSRISLTEGLFLWFVFNLTAYTKDFSYLRWPGAPVFVADVVLLLLLFSIYFLPRYRTDRRKPAFVYSSLFLFLGAGLVSAIRGLLDHRDTMLVLRDLALTVYPWFLFVGHHLCRAWVTFRRVAAWFLLGASLSVLNGLAWFLTGQEQGRFLNHGVYVLIALVGVLLATMRRSLSLRIGCILVGLLCLGLILANARSLFVSLAIVILVGLLTGQFLRGKTDHVIASVAAAIVSLFLVSFFLLHIRGGRSFAERSVDELASGVLNAHQDPNWQFRLIAWKEAWRRFQAHPLAGEGFGVPFTFEIWDNDPRPHNTFLTVLYKMGLSGFLALFALLAYFFWSTAQSIHRNSKNPRVALLQIVFLAQVSFCCFGSANLLLESPFLASLFWTGIGVGLRMVQLLEVEGSLRACPRRVDRTRTLSDATGAAQAPILGTQGPQG